MARARNIKPAFFTNEALAELPFEYRLLFIGLWTLADRAGRLEDRPKRIRMALFPADDVDVDAGLDALGQSGFIARYMAGETRAIEICNFSKHQNPHHREPESTISPPQASPRPALGPSNMEGTEALGQPEASPGPAPGKPETDHACEGGSAVLIPDSGFLIPDSGGGAADLSLITEGRGRPTEPPNGHARPLRGTRLPPDWIPGPKGLEFCREARPDLDPGDTLERFRDYWHAKPGKEGTKLDWQATWRNWVRSEARR